MKRVIAAMTAAVLMVALVSSATVAAPKSWKTFGDPGTNVVQNPKATFTITNDVGQYGGVYVQAFGAFGKHVGDVTFSFDSSGTVAGGAPRFSIPVDASGDKVTDFYAFLDVNGCGGNTHVSTTNATCTAYAGAETFTNWAALVTAHPGWKISDIPFVIADQPGTYVVWNIVLR
jgi:opacity protein-like surface antigen